MTKKKQKIKIESIYGDFIVTENCPECRYNICVIKVPDGVEVWCPKCKKFAHDIFWQALIDTKNKLDNEKQHEKIMAEAIQHNLETEQRLVQECMKAEKKLDIVVDALKSVRRRLCEMKDPSGATILRMACESATIVKNALDEITALTKGENNE